MSEKICKCIDHLIDMVDFITDARSYIHTGRYYEEAADSIDMAKEELDKLEKCLGIDLSNVREALDEAFKLTEEPRLKISKIEERLDAAILRALWAIKDKVCR